MEPNSPVLPYVRMIMNLIDGLSFSHDEIVTWLQKRVRQQSMSKRRRIDYVLRFLHQQGTERPRHRDVGPRFYIHA